MKGSRLLACGALLSVALTTGCSFLIDAQPTLPADASEATWHLDPDQPAPGPGATSFSAIVTERGCSSARDITGLILPPMIEYAADEVIVSIYVAPLQGGADCPSNPPSRLTVELREPLGDRQLVDGIGGSEDDPV